MIGAIRQWSARMWARRYWPKVGGAPPVDFPVFVRAGAVPLTPVRRMTSVTPVRRMVRLEE